MEQIRITRRRTRQRVEEPVVELPAHAAASTDAALDLLERIDALLADD
jgi:hypothetical protein